MSNRLQGKLYSRPAMDNATELPPTGCSAEQVLHPLAQFHVVFAGGC